MAVAPVFDAYDAGVPAPCFRLVFAFLQDVVKGGVLTRKRYVLRRLPRWVIILFSAIGAILLGR